MHQWFCKRLHEIRVSGPDSPQIGTGGDVAEVLDELDFSKPIVRRSALTARNLGGLATTVDFGGSGTITFDEPAAHGGTGLGPTPLQGVLAALCACEAVTFGRTSAEMGFDYSGIDFKAAFTIDIRGRSGMREVVPHFRTLKVEARVATAESQERLQEAVEETEARCPVFNLVTDAGVRIEMVWLRVAPG